MNVSGHLKQEELLLEKIIKFRLPTYFKTVGWWIFGIAATILIWRKVADVDIEIYRSVLKNIILVALLLVSLASEEVEDERSKLLRLQSYSVVFIMAVVYAIIQPHIDHIVTFLLNDGKDFSDMRAFQLVAFMLLCQIGYFHLFKKLKS